jgi:ribosomal protein S27AE
MKQVANQRCLECGSGAAHLREEREEKHCKKCGASQLFQYHVIRGVVTGKEHQIMLYKSRNEMLEHLARCQPELIREASQRFGGKHSVTPSN